MIHGAVLQTDDLLNEATEAEPFSGAAAFVFTTDGVQINAIYRGGKGFFYKNDVISQALFFTMSIEILAKKLYEMLGQEKLHILQEDMFRKIVSEATGNEKNV